MKEEKNFSVLTNSERLVSGWFFVSCNVIIYFKNMKRVRKNWRRATLRVLNIWVILMMLFQPIGTPGIIAIAEELSPPPVVEEKPAPAPEPVKEEAIAPEPAKEVTPVPEPVKEVVPVPAPTPVVPATPTVELDPVVTPAPAADLASTPVLATEPAPAAEGTAVDGTDDTGETIVPTDDTQGRITDEAAATEKLDPTETVPVVNEKKCLADGTEIKTSAVTDWEIDGDIAKTKEDVQLGVKYEFPQNNDVSVTFT
jgi:hypothetical protein